MELQIGTVSFVLGLGPSSPHKEYLPSSDNCVEMSGGNVLKTKGNFHMETQTHCLYVCANVHFMKLSGLFFCWPRRKNTRSIVGGHHSVIVYKSDNLQYNTVGTLKWEVVQYFMHCNVKKKLRVFRQTFSFFLIFMYPVHEV